VNPTTERQLRIQARSETVIAEGNSLTSDSQALSDHIRSTLKRYGWLHVEHRMSIADFEGLARRLGEIELRTDIVVDPELERRQNSSRAHRRERPGVYQASALGLHTDRPTAGILAWFCVEPDSKVGATLLADTKDLADHFSTAELDELGGVKVEYLRQDSSAETEILSLAPLLERRGDGWGLYYVPWLIKPPAEKGLLLLERLARFVRDKEAHDLVSVRLERGQSLFIDNRRMLHGRGELPKDSRRHLVRLYIRTDGAAR
jgi:Taurine catabolism dioxygenase TauD, TfdA family